MLIWTGLPILDLFGMKVDGGALQADGAKKTLALKPENLSNLAGRTARSSERRMYGRKLAHTHVPAGNCRRAVL